MSIDHVLNKLQSPQERTYGEWSAFCPCCAVPKQRLLVRVDGNGQTDIHCMRGCPPWQILQALGLPFRVLFPTKGNVYHAPDVGWWKQPRRYDRWPLPSMQEQ